MTTTDLILKACTTPAGMTRAELMAATGKTGHIVSATVQWLLSKDRLHKAGIYRHYRYFADKGDAAAWDLVAQAEYVAIRQAARSKTLADKARSEREKRGSTADYQPRTAKRSKQRKTEPAQHQRLILSQERIAEPAKPVKVIWPETVKVQVHPTPPSRFAFEPPPGWRGQITNDWMERRLQGVQA